MARTMTLAPPRRASRRRRARGSVSRAATFGPALVLPAWGWTQAGEPLHWAGLAVMMVLGLAVIPGVVVLGLLSGPRSLPALMRRSWRKRYRNWRKHTRLSWLQQGRQEQRSSRITDFQRRVTFAADRYRCIHCRRRYSRSQLNADHYCPWSQGGMTVLGNLLTLCQDCNLVKSNYWRGVFYRPVDGYEDKALAAEILGSERRLRHNPVRMTLRLTRAAWALGA